MGALKNYYHDEIVEGLEEPGPDDSEEWFETQDKDRKWINQQEKDNADHSERDGRTGLQDS